LTGGTSAAKLPQATPTATKAAMGRRERAISPLCDMPPPLARAAGNRKTGGVILGLFLKREPVYTPGFMR